MPHGPYPNHRTPPPHIYQHQSSILDCDQLAGHCHTLTHIMPILCQSEDSSAHKRGTSVLQGPTEVSHRGTISRQGHRHSRADRTSLEPMSIHLQSDTNPVPIDCQSNVIQVPIHPNPMPIRCQSGAGQVAIHCQCSANHVPIHFQSNANPGPIRTSITNTPFL